MRKARQVLSLLGIAAVVATAGYSPGVAAAGPTDKINHVIVIYQENWSFDGLYGSFPGANGLANAGAADAARSTRTASPTPRCPSRSTPT